MMPISNVPPPGAGIPGWKSMKKVIEGKVYSTESSTLIHEENFSEQEDHPHPFVQQMYRTRLGKFFLVYRNEEFFNGNIDDVDRQDRIIPLTQEQAVNWMEKHCNEKITNYVQLPEAGIQHHAHPASWQVPQTPAQCRVSRRRRFHEFVVRSSP